MVQNILDLISRTKGTLQLDNEVVLSTWLKYIDRAAKELYEQNDLLDCMTTRIFDLSDDETQILALPWYVYLPKKWRAIDSGAVFSQAQQSARFQIWSDDFCNWIFVRRSPFCREILNCGPIELRLAEVEESDVVIKLSGRSTHASHAEEQVTIPAGQTSVFTTNHWHEMVSLSQIPHEHDLRVYDLEGNLMSLMPNHVSSVSYTHYRREDDLTGYNSFKGTKVEILYKPVYQPLNTVNSTFQCGDRYDDAITWKVLEHDALLNLKNTSLALTYGAKSMSSVQALLARSSTGDQKIDFGTNRFLAVQDYYGDCCSSEKFFRRA